MNAARNGTEPICRATVQNPNRAQKRSMDIPIFAAQAQARDILPQDTAGRATPLFFLAAEKSCSRVPMLCT